MKYDYESCPLPLRISRVPGKMLRISFLAYIVLLSGTEDASRSYGKLSLPS